MNICTKTLRAALTTRRTLLLSLLCLSTSGSFAIADEDVHRPLTQQTSQIESIIREVEHDTGMAGIELSANATFGETLKAMLLVQKQFAGTREKMKKAKTLSPTEQKQLVEDFNTQSAQVMSLVQRMQQRFPERTIDLSEVYGDIWRLQLGSFAKAAKLYYQAAVAGSATDKIGQKLAGCYELMFLNASLQQPDVPVSIDKFALAPNQKTITQKDIDSWKAIFALLKENANIKTLLESNEELITYGIKVLDAHRNNERQAEIRAVNANRETASPASQAADSKLQLATVLEGLKVLETGPNSIEEIEITLASLKRYRKALEAQYETIPNAEAIARAFPESEEAKILNLFYRFLVFRDHAQTLQQVEQLKSKNDDVRVMFLKVYLGKEFSRYDLCRDSLRRILELEPKNYRARHLVLALEEMEEKEKAAKAQKS